MQKSTARDVTDTYLDLGEGVITRGQFPFYWVTCKLVKALDGKLCYSLAGLDAACYDGTLKVAASTAYTATLSGKFGLAKGGVTAEVGASHTVTYTRSAEATFNVTRCSSVNPVVCYAKALLKIYQCEYETILTIGWGTEYVFDPGGTPKLYGNVVDPDPDCGCEPAATAVRDASADPGIGDPAAARSSRVFVPGSTRIRLAETDAEMDPVGAAAEGARRFAERLLEPFEADPGREVEAGIGAGTGVVWLQGPGVVPGQPQFAVLGAGMCPPTGTLAVDGAAQDLVLLAVGPCVPDLSGEVVVSVPDADGEARTVRAPVAVSTDRLTGVAARVDLTPLGLDGPADGHATLVLDTGNGECRPRELTVPFTFRPDRFA